MTESEFTKLCYDSLRKAYPTVEFKIVKDLTITSISPVDKDKEIQYYLDNTFSAYKLQPDSVSEVISKYVRLAAELYQEEKGIDVSQIVPTIKPVSFLDELKTLSEEKGSGNVPQVVYEKYNDDLIIVYAEDHVEFIAPLFVEDFEKLGISKDTLLRFSIGHLEAGLSPEIHKMTKEGSYWYSVGGDYEASFILSNSFWNKENFPVDGDFVIGIPARDLVIITGSNHFSEIEKNRAMVSDLYQKAAYPMSPHLYILKGKKFERFE